MMAPLDVLDLGRRRYHDVLELQRMLRLGRIDGAVPHDLLLLVEHDPVYTLGRGTHETSLPLSADELRARGADVVEIERGGDVTWHGPGQLVGYPIVHLSKHREDLHWYLRELEQALIDGLAGLGVPAERNPGKTGVWTRGRKIASIGIHVKQWVTLHGFALNVAPDLSWFDAIVPCGIRGVEMTSVRRELDSRESDAVLWRRTQETVVAAFGRAFGLDPRLVAPGAFPGTMATSAAQDPRDVERGVFATLAIARPTGNP
jgi:lipoyl(octanoyl) transferase